MILTKHWQKTARGTALTVLEGVFEQGAFSNLALKQELNRSALGDQDKALVTELVYGTVSRKITLEWYLSHYIADRDTLDSWVYSLLMLSLYQLLYLDKIPHRAVVHEAVSLAKQRKAGADKFVNAILRKILDGALPEIETIKRVNKRYSVQYSLPVWLVGYLIDVYGLERALKIFESLLLRSKASVRVTQPERFEEIMTATGSRPSVLAKHGLVKDQGHFAGTDYFKTGALAIQDETSQLVAPTLALKGDEFVLDACAAPGGKTVHMASYLNQGRVIALDLYEHKLALIRENAERLGLSDKVETQVLDAREVHRIFGPDTFDKILVDAPCSGIGLIRRKPDIRYNKQLSDFKELQVLQLSILDSVCQTLKKDGIITYSTCTITPEENVQVVEQFLARHPEFEQVTLSHEKKEIMVNGCLMITPELYQTDGFFIAQFRRKM
ncbi:16S rRNA (cytosine(967)-C(5))-methyltransferase RsmB [Streptococcus ovuberis]|uniref:16S rRNA (cytosine(967)-C(5))-methyltransferase RsmB n=1 Tax=Streptococcus ovuberis TaxID=1936207 RepID=UPI003CCCFCCC